MWVKICGNTNLDDALAAVEAGADALGFIFVPSSPRVVTRKAASEILAGLPSTVLTVGVVANDHPDYVKELLRVCPLRGIQFHGEESPEEVLGFKTEGRKLIKAVRVQGTQSLRVIPAYQGVDAVLLDAHSETARGGTGTSFNWDLAAQAKSCGIPLIMAGGLTPSNVGEVVRRVQPFGVDVSSGVESSPGQKDRALVREFVVQARSLGRTKSVGSA